MKNFEALYLIQMDILTRKNAAVKKKSCMFQLVTDQEQEYRTSEKQNL